MERPMRDRNPAAATLAAVGALPGRRAAANVLGTVRRGLHRGVVGLGFWAAVLLPLAYVPHVVTGVQTRADGMLLFALLVAHVVALVVGHDYGR